MSELHPAAPEPTTEPQQPHPTPPRRRRTGLLLAILASVLVLTLAAVSPFVVQQIRADRIAATPANLDDVVVFEDLGNDHTEKEIEYGSVPPAGGPHDPAWLDCGAYDEPVRDENAVHDLEHGAVWITYDPELPAAEVAELLAALPPNGILSPYVDLPAPVVVTVWERQLRLNGANDPRLQLFLDEFSDGGTSPEPFASCNGGVSNGDGASTTDV